MSLDQVLSPLNPEQREAVVFTNGPLLILAGPGSGKTRVITHKIAYLLETGTDPDQILAVTFTNKAANEMKSRVEALIGGRYRLPWIHTFHATCARVLRAHISALSPNYSSSFTILDEGDQRSAITQVMKELDIPTEEISPGLCASVINRAKDELIGPEAFRETFAGRLETFVVEVVDRVYRRYQDALEKSNALDFADLIRLTIKLFNDHLAILNLYRERFRHILVDEYQDINYAQYIFSRTLAERSECISVVGDEDQAIFSWRGSDPSYILQFEQDFPDAKVIELRMHYRWPEGDRIFKAARGLIANNRMRVKSKDASHLSGEGEAIQIYAARDQADEARAVAREIFRLWQMEGIDINDVAVLYRVNTLSRVVEEALIRERIPYEVVRGVGFYERREVKDLLAYLKFITNPHDEISLLRALERPKRGIGESTISEIKGFAAESNVSLWEAMRTLSVEPRGTLKSRQAGALRDFVSVAHEWIDKRSSLTPSELTQKILEQSGYLDELLKTSTDDERVGNIRELMGHLKEFEEAENGDLSSFLEQIALLSDVDRYTGDEGRVALLTLHASKGLEFDYVFIMGLEEKLIPHTRSISEGMLEEERRLLYVGMTRARKRLYLSFAHQRLLYGNIMLNNPSPFLAELPADDLNLLVG